MNALAVTLANIVKRLPPWAVFALGLLWVTGFGALDCMLPAEVNFRLFYLLAIAWVGWGAGRWAATVLAMVAAVLTLMEWTAAGVHLREGAMAWNLATHTIAFAALGWLIAEVKRLTHHLGWLVKQRTAALEDEVAQHKTTSARLAEAMELARLAHWEYDVASGLFTFDERFYALYGTTAEREGGRQMSPEAYVREFLLPEDARRVADGIATTLAATDPNYSVQIEHRIRRRDGQIRDLLVRVVLVKDSRGQTIKTRGVNQDITERKRAEEALREARDSLERRVLERTAELQEAHAALLESEVKYRRLHESIQDAVAMVDMSGKFIEANSAFQILYGYTEDELRSLTWAHLTPERWSAFSERMVAQAVQRGHSDVYEKEYRCKNGTIFPAEVRTFLIRDSDGRPAAIWGIVRDITERKRTEQTLRQLNETLEQRVNERTALLRQSEERFRALSEAAFEGVFLSRHGRILECNQQLASILGYTREELLGRDLLDAVAPEWRATVHDDIQSGREVATELEVLCKDGSRRLFEAHGRSPEGKDGLRLSAVRDVTERKAAEQRLADVMEFNRTLIAHAPVGILAYKADGQCVLVNEAAARIVGGSVAEMGRQNFRQLDSWRRSPLLEIAETVLQTGRAQHREFVSTTSFGRTICLNAQFAAFASKGETHLLVLLRDITARKQAQEALQKSQNELAAFFTDSPLGLLWVAADGRIVRVNSAQLGLLGCSAEEALGHPIFEFHVEPETARDILGRLARRETVQNCRARVRHKSGAIKHVLIDANGLWEKEQLGHSRWFVRDITPRVELEREILETTEREQRRLGHDLHDDLCQQLAGVQFLSQTLTSDLAAKSAPEADQAREIAQSIKHAMSQTRDLARGLSPVGLEADGLMEALGVLAKRTEKVFRIPCRFRCEAPVLIPDHSVAIHFYRIAQEAVGNAVKHSKASAIDIRLAAAGTGLRLGVGDNGIGIPQELPRQKGMGLRIMRYRAAVIGGSLLVQHKPAGGTSVVCTVTDGLLPPNERNRK